MLHNGRSVDNPDCKTTREIRLKNTSVYGVQMEIVRGFPNPSGRTCYINSVLVLLCETVGFKTLSLFEPWLRLLHNRRSVDNPDWYLELIRTIKETVRIDVSVFNDAHEFYVMLIDTLHEKHRKSLPQASYRVDASYDEYMRANDTYAFRNFFTVECVTSTCARCSKKETRLESTNCYHIPLSGSDDMQSALRVHYATQEVTVECDACSERATEHRIERSIWRPSKVVAVRSSREKFANGRVGVSRDPMTLPSKLDMRAYGHKRALGVYRLLGVIEHFGDAYRGHYTASVHDSAGGFTWFDDDSPPVRKDPDPRCVVMAFYELVTFKN